MGDSHSHVAADNARRRPMAAVENPGGIAGATAAAFFFSGFSALFYQVIWLRKLSVTFGNTTVAISVTLAAFMTGLAIGSYALGARADRVARPLRLYAVLEVLIGVYGLASLGLLDAVHLRYLALARRLPLDSAALVSFQFCASFLVLVAPTALMGGTLPVAVRGLVRALPALGPQVGSLYGINTLGAAAGVLCVSFFLLPVLGLHGAVLLAAAVNVAVGVAMLGIEAKCALPPPTPESALTPAPDGDGPTSRPLLAALGTGFALGGFSGLAMEVVWTRAFSLYIGSSVYAFSAIVLAVLVGIAAGSLVAARWFAHREAAPSWFAYTQLGAGLATLLLVLIYGQLAYVFLDVVVRLQHSYPLLLATEVLVIMACLAPATFLSGAAFPIGMRVCVRRSSAMSRGIGLLYAANTVGCIAGALAAGFLLIPGVGLRATALLCSALYVITGAAVLLLEPGRRRLIGGASLVGLAVALLVIPGWSPRIMSSEFFRAPAPSAERPASAVIAAARRVTDEDKRVLFYREGALATVAVLQLGDRRSLMGNGKTEASDGPADMQTQLLSAHLPMLMAPRAKSALVVGLGSGTTSGALTLYGLERVDCVEIEPAMAQAARYFSRINRNVLSARRFHLIAADARNYLAATPRRYDVITSEPSNPWVAGVAGLFTVEHFRALRQSLSDDGVVCQWLHLYSMAPRDVASVVASFVEVFPDATMWWIAPGYSDLALIARKRPWKVDYRQFSASFGQSLQIREDLARAGFASPLDLLSRLALGPGDLQRMARAGRLNTDDFPSLEFSAPRHLYRRGEAAGEETIRFLASCKSDPLCKIVEFDPAGRDARTRAALSDMLLRRHHPFVRDTMYVRWAREELATAVALAPQRAEWRSRLGRIERQIAAGSDHGDGAPR